LRNESAGPAARENETGCFTLLVGPGDRIDGEAEVARESADRGQPSSGDEFSVHDLGQELHANLFEGRSCGSRVDFDHRDASPGVSER
jgi:hypothetical protein